MIELGENVWELPEYEFRALRWAEYYGIIEYQVKGNKMRYSRIHEIDVFRHKKKYIYEVDLDSMTSKCINPGRVDLIDNKEEER